MYDLKKGTEVPEVLILYLASHGEDAEFWLVAHSDLFRLYKNERLNHLKNVT